MKNVIFKTNLKREIKKHGLKSYEVAKILNITPQTFTAKLNKCTFTVMELWQLEELLNISFSDLCIKIEGYKYKSQKPIKKKEKKTVSNKDIQHGSKYDYSKLL